MAAHRFPADYDGIIAGAPGTAASYGFRVRGLWWAKAILEDPAGVIRPAPQGQSLAPLLRGQPGWSARPVILDHFATDAATGQLRGELAVVDGRWGASLWVGPQPAVPEARRPWPLLLFDLWNARCASCRSTRSTRISWTSNTKFLQDQWKDHQALAKPFKPGPKTVLTPEQLERRRSLGYIR